MKSFYEPTTEHLDRLVCPWVASYSGGKDSTSLVTWIEWLRRAGWIECPNPRLIQSDTGVEDVGLQAVSAKMMDVLTASGWSCMVVKPLIHERLYNRILGLGVTPIHPGIRTMRWCTRSTKIAPINRVKLASGETSLTGLRLGESRMRDGKIKTSCAAGGECGIPEQSRDTYSPILHWSTCQVVDWLSGRVDKSVRSRIHDILDATRQLIEIYSIGIDRNVFDWADPVVTASRFGCIGCPAISAEATAPRSVIARYGEPSPICELYAVWHEARQKKNRCQPHAGDRQHGPIRIAARKQLFARVLDIQQRAGIQLVTPDDEAWIRDCWEHGRYPRGWSAADEATAPPAESSLFDELASVKS